MSTVVNKRIISRVIEQIINDNNLVNIIKYAIFEPESRKLIIITNVLNEIIEILINNEIARVQNNVKELHVILNEETNVLDKDIINNINDKIVSLTNYSNHLKKIKQKILFTVDLLRLRLEYTDRKLYVSELSEYQDKILRYFHDTASELIDIIFNAKKYFSDQTEIDKQLEELDFMIKQISIKWSELKDVLNTLFEYEDLILRISVGIEKDDALTELHKRLQEFIHKAHIEIVKTITRSSYDDISERKNTNKKLFDKLSLLNISSNDMVDDLVDYINTTYATYETGNVIFDQRLNNIEAGSVYLIAAPTNHGKTLFLVELLRSIIQFNQHLFSSDNDKKDAILFITLEDSRIKVLNRIYSVFGNFQYKHLVKLQKNLRYMKELINTDDPNEINEFKKFVEQLYDFIKSNSIDRITNNKVEIFVQDARDKEYSAVNIVSTIEQLKTLGYNIRVIFLDYIELMNSTKKYEKEYSEQGQVVIDLRNIANTYMIPIIAATQLNRSAEDLSSELTNKVIGDSYNKAKFSDYIIMVRQIKDELLNEQIENNESDNNQNRRGRKKNKIQFTPRELISALIPISLSTTKLIKDYDNNVNFIDFKKLVYESKLRKKTKKSQDVNNLITVPDITDIIQQSSIQTINNEVIHQTNTISAKNNVQQPLEELMFDSQLISELFRLVQYNIPKAKDGLTNINTYEFIKMLNEKIDRVYPELKDKIKYTPEYIHVKDIIYSEYKSPLNHIIELSNQYILFAKFNLRIYSLPELPILLYDYVKSIDNFKMIENFLNSHPFYQKIITRVS